MRYCPEDTEYAISKAFFTKTKLVLDFTTGKERVLILSNKKAKYSYFVVMIGITIFILISIVIIVILVKAKNRSDEQFYTEI